MSPRMKNCWVKNRKIEGLNKIIWMIEWLHSHWVTNCYLWENRNNKIWTQNLSRVLVSRWRVFVGFKFRIEEPQICRFYEIVLVVCRPVRCKDKQGNKGKKLFFRLQISKEIDPLIYIINFFVLILKKKICLFEFCDS